HCSSIVWVSVTLFSKNIQRRLRLWIAQHQWAASNSPQAVKCGTWWRRPKKWHLKGWPRLRQPRGILKSVPDCHLMKHHLEAEHQEEPREEHRKLQPLSLRSLLRILCRRADGSLGRRDQAVSRSSHKHPNIENGHWRWQMPASNWKELEAAIGYCFN